MAELEDLFDAERVLVLGVGGGGDVVGCVPTRDLLRRHGVDVLIGGVPWERVPYDPQPGPRPFSDIEGHEAVSDGVALCTADTRTRDGVRFTESLVAEQTGEPTVLLDITGGPARAARALESAMDALGVDHVVGVDAGGDALAAGGEPGLSSPLADGVALAALHRLDRGAVLGVIGWGSDGELTHGELEAAYARVARDGGYLGAWGITPRTAARMRALLDVAPTEASRLPWESARGDVGPRAIREGRRSLTVTHASNVTLYFRASVVAAHSGPAHLVADAPSLDAADRILRDAGYATELAFERQWARDQGSGDGPVEP